MKLAQTRKDFELLSLIYLLISIESLSNLLIIFLFESSSPDFTFTHKFYIEKIFAKFKFLKGNPS